jgi:RND family efflux transporter MFP subunit
MTVRILPMIVLAAAGAAACSSVPDTPQDAAAPMAVTVAPVTESDWPAIVEAGGVVLARDTAVLSSRVLAPIASVKVRAGDRVSRGQVLVELDAADLTANAGRAAGAAAAAEHAAVAAGADLKSAESAVALARTTHARVTKLVAERSATQQELDEAQATLSAAEARLAAAHARISEARASLDAARAGNRAADITASFGVITAPFDGVVVERAVDPGTMAAPGQTLLVIENTSAFRLEVRVDSSRVPLVSAGQVVHVRLDAAGPDAPWHDGRVAEIARIDPAGHSFAVKIDLPADPAWRSGLFGRARLRGATRRVLSVPTEAVVARGQMHYAFVVSGESHAQLRAITVGATHETRTEILDGLVSGEVVVTPVPPTLKDGAKVTTGAAR